MKNEKDNRDIQFKIYELQPAQGDSPTSGGSLSISPAAPNPQLAPFQSQVIPDGIYYPGIK
ncbi:MAG: hypothetical protein ABI707_01425 [Ferruginibacter sp.]